MIVVPLVLFSIIAGVVSLDDVKKVGAIGGKTVLFYLATTACAVTLGLIFANVMNVGAGYTMPSGELSYEATEPPSLIDTIVNMFPSNFFQPMADATMLQVIVIAVVFGFGMIAAGKKAEPVIKICNAMSDVCIAIMRGIILVAPFGVFGLICPVIANNGIDVLRPLLWLIVVAYVAMIVPDHPGVLGHHQNLRPHEPAEVLTRRNAGHGLRLRLGIIYGHATH